MKKIIITKTGCRQLANHLWNYLSVYAYGLETGATVLNHSFLEWHRYFNLGGLALPSFLGRMGRLIDSLYGSYIVRVHKLATLLAVNEIVLLPPSVSRTLPDTTYCIGWFFRNPRGLEKYRNALVTAFLPRPHICAKIDTTVTSLAPKTLIGIHLRQQPYPGFPAGDFLISPTRVREIVEEYLHEENLDKSEVALVIVSDGDVDPVAFGEYVVHTSHEDAVTDLFLLSRCRAVIGTNSTFANLAAWFGNVPHIVTTNEPIDWPYYREESTYFENKYATFAH